MRFLLGFLLDYCIRGKKPLLIGTLTAIATFCFIVLPAIALSQLALSVRRDDSHDHHKHRFRWS